MREDGQNQLKIAAPFPFRKACQLMLLSAKSITLYSPFKLVEEFIAQD
jgi:hypothetical protein